MDIVNENFSKFKHKFEKLINIYLKDYHNKDLELNDDTYKDILELIEKDEIMHHPLTKNYFTNKNFKKIYEFKLDQITKIMQL